MQRNPQPPVRDPSRARQGYPPQQTSSGGQRPVNRPPQSGQAVRRPQSPTASPQRPPQGTRPVNPAPRPPQSSARYPSQGTPQRPMNRPPQQARPQTQRPAPRRFLRTIAAPFAARRDMMPVWIASGLIAVVFIVGCLLQYVIYPNGYFPSASAKDVEVVAEFSSSKGVRINEVMTSNKTAYSNSDGDYPDWIELTNASGASVDITGWALLDKSSRSTYFVFPEYGLNPGESVVIFASGHLANEKGADFHAPFRLSSAGDTLMLSDAHSVVVESINIPALGANQSYARMDSGWTITSEYTPGLDNTKLNHAALVNTQPMTGGTLVISEIMADNASYTAADGLLYDWVEIQNIGSAPVSLNGCSLSDNGSKPAQWKFPDVTIQPNQCIVIYASGLNKYENGMLHTNFGLRAEGESVLLYNEKGQVMDYIEYDNLKTNQSLKRQPDGSYSTAGTPSPGQVN